MDFFRGEVHELGEMGVAEGAVFEEDVVGDDLAGVVEGSDDMAEEGMDGCGFWRRRGHGESFSNDGDGILFLTNWD